MPQFVTAKNPADLTFDQAPEQVEEIVRTCAADEDVSSFIVALQAEMIEIYQL